MTKEQGAAVLASLGEIRDLLRQVVETTATGAVLSKDILAELARPRLDSERFRALQNESLARSEAERAATKAAREAKDAERAACTPRLFFRAHGLPPNVGRLPEGESGP